MIYEPINWYPSMFVGDGNNIIDATADNNFSVELNCSGYIYAYKIIVRQNTPESTAVYTPDVVRIDGGHAPTTPDGKPNPLVIEVPADSLGNNANGYKEGYKWQLCLWETDAGENATASEWDEAEHYTTHEYMFYAKDASTLSIDTTGWTGYNGVYQSIDGKSKTFHANYSSPDPIQWYRWNVATVTDGVIDEPFYTTGRVYSFQTDFTFEMFVTGYTYAVQVEVYNHAGVYLKSDWVIFPVTYDVIAVKGSNQAVMEDNGINVMWSGICYILGKSIDENGDEVEPGTWGESDYKYGMLKDWPVEGEWALDITSGIRTVFESNDNYDVEVDKEGTMVISVHVPPYSGERVNVLRIDYEDGTVDVLDHVGFVEGLYPSGTLVPGGSLTPDAGKGGMFIFSAHGSEMIPLVTTEADKTHKNFYTRQEEQFMVYGSVSYEPTTFPTLNPASKVYNIAISNGKMKVVEHDAPIITDAHHYIEPSS